MEVTTAVKVTAWLKLDGFGVELIVVVVVVRAALRLEAPASNRISRANVFILFLSPHGQKALSYPSRSTVTC